MALLKFFLLCLPVGVVIGLILGLTLSLGELKEMDKRG